MPTQQEYNVAKQINRKLYSKFEIMNYSFQVVGNLEGVVVGTPSFSNDSNSSIRRTCNIQIIPTNVSFDINKSGKLWIDKYVKVYIGIYDERNDEVIYTNMGIYLINNPSQVYSVTDNIITISGIDLMARLTGMRNGNLEGLEYFIPQNSNVRNVLINTISLLGFSKYIISEYPILTPYDISISVGGNAYDIINEIINILPNWQTYFDVDGVFHFEPIPNGENEQIMVKDDLWSNVLINYNKDYNYDNVKNYVEVLGNAETTKQTSQPYAISKETNPQSPFYYDSSNIDTMLRIVLSGDEYDNINTDSLAQQRADFELYQRCRLQDSVTISVVPIYWLDTNWLIEITLPNKQGTEETNQYLIKSINTTLGTSGTQNISLMRYYPYYPSI